MAGTWMVPLMSSNCITPGCLAGIIFCGPGSMVTAVPIIVSRFWNAVAHLLMVCCISLVPMVLIRLGVAPSYIGSLPSPRLPLGISSRLHQMIQGCFVAFPAETYVTSTTMAFLISITIS